MKLVFNVLAALGLLASANAFANGPQQDRHSNFEMSERASSVPKIPFCGGSASVQRLGGTLYLVISNTHNCSDITMDGKLIGHLHDGEGTDYVGLKERVGQNSFIVRAQSENGNTSATFHVQSYRQPAPKNQINASSPADFTLSTTLFGLRSGYLDDCGGEAFLIISGGKAYVDLSRMQRCGEYDILAVDGRPVEFPKTSIGAPIQLGYLGQDNTYKIVVRSQNAKKTGNYDVFDVRVK